MDRYQPGSADRVCSVTAGAIQRMLAKGLYARRAVISRSRITPQSRFAGAGHAARQAPLGREQNYLPRADVVWQMNRATDNNITGLLLRNRSSPDFRPRAGMTSNRSAWEARRAFVLWEPLDFGYRGAKVGAARAVGSSHAEASLTRLDVAVAT